MKIGRLEISRINHRLMLQNVSVLNHVGIAVLLAHLVPGHVPDTGNKVEKQKHKGDYEQYGKNCRCSFGLVQGILVVVKLGSERIFQISRVIKGMLS
jgi:hypothetical protein